MNLYFIIVGIFFLIISCNNAPDRIVGPNSNLYSDVDSKYFIIDTPIGIGGARDIFYKRKKERESQIGLTNLENGFDSLQIRLWIAGGLFPRREVYVIGYSDKIWKGKFYVLEVDSNFINGNGETRFLNGPEPVSIISERIVKPKQGWSNFIDTLMYFQLPNLPGIDKMQELIYPSTDQDSYHIEFATSHQYRFYTFTDPKRVADKFWQAKNMENIINHFINDLE